MQITCLDRATQTAHYNKLNCFLRAYKNLKDLTVRYCRHLTSKIHKMNKICMQLFKNNKAILKNQNHRVHN